MIRAVIFDMYETLITHYESPLYFGSQMAADAGIPESGFRPLWHASENDRAIGKASLEEILTRILQKNHCYSEELLMKIVNKRMEAKKECFRHLHPEILSMLSELKEQKIRIGLISNCFSEEASVIRNSSLFPYFDAACLSYEQGVQKPDAEIFERCMASLAVKPEECLYVGDGGSDELEAARDLGMTAVQAVWYLRKGSGQPCGVKQGFPHFDSPREVPEYLWKSRERTLYVTDLDGTLMRDDKSISGTTAAIINKLIDQGMLITYATARSKKSASVITRDIHFKIPVITLNGTIFVDPQTNEEIETVAFTREELQILRQCQKGLDVPGYVSAFINGKDRKSYRKGKVNPGFQHYLEEHADDKRLRMVQTEEELYDGKVCCFTYIAEQEELLPLYQRVKDNEKWICIFQKDKYRSEYWLEICPKNAAKDNAVRRLQRQYNCQRLVVFGDSLNDISMFRIADEAYAVENAVEELKAIATKVIGDNNSDSVACWLGHEM